MSRYHSYLLVEESIQYYISFLRASRKKIVHIPFASFTHPTIEIEINVQAQRHYKYSTSQS